MLSAWTTGNAISIALEPPSRRTMLSASRLRATFAQTLVPSAAR